MDLRLLGEQDAPLIVEATAQESGRALWGARRGPYTLDQARAALVAWNGYNFGLTQSGRLLAAVGVMPDGPGSAEIAYWVRPEQRRKGLGLRGLTKVTEWAHDQGGFTRLWLEINPDNVASSRLAERAGYQWESVEPQHCRSWLTENPEDDVWHDCSMWTHYDERS
ncbi:GNAT family N-acetyltransferase [Kibdelosporangium philippinense]|uniref:GNAT family N-acetyltransferase n=1 Tax=Kibdelosporangium philippinense TaxID=211113 RepID=A0ABS8ZWZ4_9PSEU|nr:GNAT family N-acetyltransferase [Kibdelosporangium philippinense]MCE7010923.1 GNAT family N-acetyltransferase [Kibdelosporangium philippinense]